jgi:3-dehydroquinate dehydratase-1
MRYKICCPLPIKSLDLAENAELIRKVNQIHPDLIEFRFDYLKDFKDFSEKLPLFLKKEIDSSIQSIFTLRDFTEGGRIELNGKKKLAIFTHLINASPDFIDFELRFDLKTIQHIIKLAQSKNVNLILSHHDFEKTPSVERIINVISNFENKLDDITQSLIKNVTYKFVFKAITAEDNLIPLNLCRFLSNQGKRVISFCMGDLGILSRVACVKFGSLWTYGSFEETTAPGQIKVEEIRKLINLLF